MKFFIIYAAVLVLVEAGQISPEATVHQVSVPVPLTVLAPPLTAEQQQEADNVKPATVQEVTKDHKHVVDRPTTTVTEEIPVTVQPIEEDIKKTTVLAIVTGATEKRQGHAVPFTDKEPQLATDINVVKNILNQRKQSNKPNMVTPQRSVRSLEPQVTSPVTVTTKSTDSGSSTAATIDPCDLLCTKFEFDPICATNGLCMHEFPNQCILETYNCKHASQKFTVTKNDRCQMPGVAKCNENDMI